MIGEKRSHTTADAWEGRGVDVGIVFQRALSIGLTGNPVALPAGPSVAAPAAIISGPVNFAPNAYTFTLIDSQNLVSASIEAQITTCANYVIGLISHYVEWQGTIDFVVDIKPASESPYPAIDGISPSVAQIAWNGSAWINQTLEECLTGVDSNASLPDAGCTIYLAADGTIRNYGAPVWFDPNPQFEVNANVPAGTHDFVGIYTHEIFHALGFYQITQQWQDEIATQGNISYFGGAAAVSLYGGPVPFAAGFDHYGYHQDPTIPISRGLMYEFGNYERNRIDIGRIDLAILADLGHSIKTYDGLALFEMIDTQLNLTGTAAADRLYGDYHANILDGAGGADVMTGGSGNDIYFVDHAGDVAEDLANEGHDTVYSSVSYILGAGQHVEVLSTISHAAATAINLSGNSFAQTLVGNAGANVLNGRGGADTLVGLGGNDTYYIDDATVRINEIADGGTDTAYSSVSYVLGGGQHVEILSTVSHGSTAAINLTGNALVQTLVGNAGANVLNGRGGADTLVGLGGNDTYYIDDATVRINEIAGGGTDTAYSSVSYVLGGGQHVETLSTVSHGSTAAINLTGNALVQTLVGNAGANVLNGGGGADTLVGLGGNDTYYIDDATVRINEIAGGGTDTAYSSVSYVLGGGQHVETLSTVSQGSTAAINLTGNALVQTLVGNAGANVLNGRGGADTLVGLGGNDTYYIDVAAVQVVEGAGDGADIIYSSVSYTLGAAAQVETLSTVSHGAIAAINLTGNGFNNTIYGNSGANVIDGKGGNDALLGLAGADTFAFTTAPGAGNVDLILNYSVADDTIALDDAVFTGLGLGALNPNAFVTGPAAADADDRIIYNSATGALLFDADGNGADAAIQFASIGTGLSLTASDFIVI